MHASNHSSSNLSCKPNRLRLVYFEVLSLYLHGNSNLTYQANSMRTQRLKFGCVLRWQSWKMNKMLMECWNCVSKIYLLRLMCRHLAKYVYAVRTQTHWWDILPNPLRARISLAKRIYVLLLYYIFYISHFTLKKLIAKAIFHHQRPPRSFSIFIFAFIRFFFFFHESILNAYQFLTWFHIRFQLNDVPGCR